MAAPIVVAVIVPLLVMAATVRFPLAVMVVNEPVLACPTTLPIGVFCSPPAACTVVVNTPDVLTVNPLTVALAVPVITLALIGPPYVVIYDATLELHMLQPVQLVDCRYQ